MKLLALLAENSLKSGWYLESVLCFLKNQVLSSQNNDGISYWPQYFSYLLTEKSNNLKRARNDLKQPIACKKWPETKWKNLRPARNNLWQARKNLEQPTGSKNPPEIDHLNEQKVTWNDLYRRDSKFMEPL